MAKYQKKKVVVNAVQLIDDNKDAILQFMEETNCPFEMIGRYSLVIHTLEGDMRADEGDWVIQGVAGEFYPCKPHIFELTYEPYDGESDG